MVMPETTYLRCPLCGCLFLKNHHKQKYCLHCRTILKPKKYNANYREKLNKENIKYRNYMNTPIGYRKDCKLMPTFANRECYENNEINKENKFYSLIKKLIDKVKEILLKSFKRRSKSDNTNTTGLP